MEQGIAINHAVIYSSLYFVLQVMVQIFTFIFKKKTSNNIRKHILKQISNACVSNTIDTVKTMKYSQCSHP